MSNPFFDHPILKLPEERLSADFAKKVAAEFDKMIAQATQT